MGGFEGIQSRRKCLIFAAAPDFSEHLALHMGTSLVAGQPDLHEITGCMVKSPYLLISKQLSWVRWQRVLQAEQTCCHK